MAERADPRQRARVRGPARVVRLLLVGVALALAFLLGIAFARTLDERPEDGATVTSVRTLSPLPQSGPMRTVTVTVTAP
ncbi:MAG TPA: hypothetical protein VFR38_13685 [Gaiellaceae bacterium]|nr:hypothetical protein [Gaiellaceae bacterium]